MKQTVKKLRVPDILEGKKILKELKDLLPIIKLNNVITTNFENLDVLTY